MLTLSELPCSRRAKIRAGLGTRRTNSTPAALPLPIGRGLGSGPQLPYGRHKLGQFPARVEHARLYGSLGGACNLGNVFDRLAVIVDEVQDLPVLVRQVANALAQQLGLVLFQQADFRIVCRVANFSRDLLIELRVHPAATGG